MAKPNGKVAKRPTKRTPRKVKSTKAAKGSAITRASGRHVELRRHAGVDYITDPDGRSIVHHFTRDDREYRDQVSERQFRQWSTEDKWADRREQYWNEIETRMLDSLQDQILRVRFKELGEMQEDRSHLVEYMRPLRDKNGTVIRHEVGHEHEGLPKFPLKMPSMDRFIKSILDLDERIMLKRGEAITRTETIGSKTKVTATALDPVGSLMNLTREEARKLAQNLLRDRMGDRYEGVLDLVEGDAKDDGGTEEDEL